MLSIDQIFASTDYNESSYDRPRWSTDQNFYTTLHGNEIIWHNANTGERSVFVSSARLTSSNLGSKPITIEDYVTSANRSRVLIFTDSQKVWRTNSRGSYYILELSPEKSTGVDCLVQLGGQPGLRDLMYASLSPDGNLCAYVRQNNIFVEDLSTHVVTQLTFDGSDAIINGHFDWVYEEELHLQSGFKWSPCGNFIAYWQVDQSQVSVMKIVNNTDFLYATTTDIPYPKCGETNSSVRCGVVAVKIESPSNSAGGGATTRWLDVPGDPRENYLCDLDFVPATGEIVVQQLNRQQNLLKMYLADPVTLEMSVVYSDTDEAWVDAARNQGVRWLRGGCDHQLLTLSERNGWRQLFLVSASASTASASPAPVALTPELMDVESVAGVDADLGVVYFIASPEDPLRRYLFSVPLDGQATCTRVTPVSAEFIGTNGYSLSADCKFAVHTLSRFDRPPVTTLISLPSHGPAAVEPLNSNEALWRRCREVAATLPPVEFFTVDIGGGISLDAWCLKPPNFDPTAKAAYPLLFHVYGEPAAAIVQDSWQRKLGLWHRMLAQRGTVVVCMDNRGTPCPKGREWRKCVYRQVGILGSEDQAAGARAVLADRPYLDPARVGIWGWSGGGSMSLNALFRHPNLYKAAVSVAPVPDMLLYDTIYQERYMDTPQRNPEGYRDGSPITFVGQMLDSQHLLLVHGTGDDNCHYQGTERLINKLVRHNKQFSMLAYPNRSHAICEGANTSRHLFTAMARFLLDKLGLPSL